MTQIYSTQPSARRKLAPSGAVFALDDDQAYRRWREAKLANYPRSAQDIAVEISSLAAPTPAETEAVLALCGRANMCRYHCREHLGDVKETRRALAAFAKHFGLSRFEAHRSAEADGIVALEVSHERQQLGYIPYSSRSMGWHTDGYYNYEEPARMIRSMLLHCVRSADHGGENSLLDHEIAYIRLRDENPDFIAALMHPAAMTIPANEETNGKVRGENTGPVFALNPESGALSMRYTARKRNILWRDDAATRAAVSMLERVLREDPFVLRVKLAPGEGVICNNILHNRIEFETAEDKESGRLIYRIRSYDRINNSELAQQTAVMEGTRL
jgi:alpha-ketoglutarate-dependent taurine dioxygenase